jgi:uncharacterized repeat protein (TIGR01451 family)
LPGGALEDYTHTKPHQGDGTNSSQAHPNQTFGGHGYAASVTLTTDKPVDTNVDFGFTDGVNIGDTVWIDLNQNGIQDEGDIGIANVVVTVIYPDGQTYTTTTDSNGHYYFDVPPGQAYTITIGFGNGSPLDAYQPTQPDAGNDDSLDSDSHYDELCNCLIITTPVITTDNHSFDFGLIQKIDMAIEKLVALSRVTPTQEVTYTIFVTNTGSLSFSQVVITDTMPPETNYVPGSAEYVLRTSQPAEPAIDGRILLWKLNVNFEPGEVIKVTFLATLPVTIATYRNRVDVETIRSPDSLTATTDVTVGVQDPEIDLTKEMIAFSMAERLITFTIRITNTGPNVLDVMPLFDTFRGPVEYIGGNVPADIVDNQNQALGWNDLTIAFGNIQPGQTIELVTLFRITSDTFTMTNQAVVSGGLDTDGNSINSGTATVVFGEQPQLSFSKRVSPTSQVSSGDRLDYQLCYNNTGNQVATGMVITDFIPLNTTYIAGTVSGNAEFYDGTSWQQTEPISVTAIRWRLDDMPVGGAEQCVSFGVTVNRVLVTTNNLGQRLTVIATEDGWQLVNSSSLKTYLPLLIQPRVVSSKLYLPLIMADGTGELIAAPTVAPLIQAESLTATERILPFEAVTIIIANTAMIVGDDGITHTDTVSNSILKIANPIVTKSANVSEAQAGDQVRFDIVVSNPSPPANAAATNLIVSDPLPLQLDLISYDLSRPDLLARVTVITKIVPVAGHPLGIDQAVATTITLDVPSLQPNEIITMSIVARVNGLANPPPQTIRNKVTMVSSGIITTYTDETTIDIPIVKLPPSPTPTPSTETPTPTTPTPTPTSRPSTGGHDDDDRDNTPTPSSSSVVTTPASSQPLPTPTMPVFLLPETGTQPVDATGGLWLFVLLVLMVGGAVYVRRR